MSPADKAGLLRKLAYLDGGICAAVGVMHVFKGSDITFGVGPEGNINGDSQERFYGALFAGYGASWLWTARQPQMQPQLVRFLAGTMAFGGVGRVLSIRERGLPHPFWTAMAGIELVTPALLIWLSEAGQP